MWSEAKRDAVEKAKAKKDDAGLRPEDERAIKGYVTDIATLVTGG